MRCTIIAENFEIETVKTIRYQTLLPEAKWMEWLDPPKTSPFRNSYAF